MEIKKFNLAVCLVAFGSVIFATLMYYLGHISALYQLAYMPMDIIGLMLRRLSFSSKFGDMTAWVLYIGICLIPAGFVMKKYFNLAKLKKQPCETFVTKDNHLDLSDMILIVLSLYLFFMMYCFVNPGMISIILPDMMRNDLIDIFSVLKNILAGVAYSLVIGYAVLKFAGSFNKTDIWKKTESILIICTLLYVAFVCLTMPLNLYQQYGIAKASDSISFVIMSNFFLELLPMACFVGIMESGVNLIHALKQNKYGEEAVSSAKLLAERSRRTVIVSVLCNIIKNFIQLIFWHKNFHANFFFDVPFLPLILAFVGLLIAEYLKESSSLYDDNKMII